MYTSLLLLLVCAHSVYALKLQQQPEFDVTDSTYDEECGNRFNYKCWKKGGHSLQGKTHKWEWEIHSEGARPVCTPAALRGKTPAEGHTHCRTTTVKTDGNFQGGACLAGECTATEVDGCGTCQKDVYINAAGVCDNSKGWAPIDSSAITEANKKKCCFVKGVALYGSDRTAAAVNKACVGSVGETGYSADLWLIKFNNVPDVHFSCRHACAKTTAFHTAGNVNDANYCSMTQGADAAAALTNFNALPCVGGTLSTSKYKTCYFALPAGGEKTEQYRDKNWGCTSDYLEFRRKDNANFHPCPASLTL